MNRARWLLGAAIVFACVPALAADETEATLARMTKTSRSVRDLLRTARRKGTERQIKCVDESLSRVDVAGREARKKAAEARAAQARGDGEVAARARRRLAELDTAARLAARDAVKCMPPPPPPPKVVLGTIVRVTIDPNIPPWTVD